MVKGVSFKPDAALKANVNYSGQVAYAELSKSIKPQPALLPFRQPIMPFGLPLAGRIGHNDISGLV